MLTFGLQWAYALALVAVAVLSVAVARRPGQPFQRLGWVITAAAFSIHSLDLVAQLAFGSVAMAGGRGSAAMNAYLRWAPVFDHSRTFLMLAAALGLVALGVVEGSVARASHYATVAVWDMAELILLLSTLFLLLLTNRVDRYLWALLAMYACSLALGTFWVTLLAQLGGGWHPPNWTLALLRVALYAAMAVIAQRRWRAGVAGRPLAGMLGRPTPRVQTLH
jgi:hypothetical protein